MEKQPTISIQRTSMLNFINSFGNSLRFLGIDPFKLDSKKAIQKAQKKAGFSIELPEMEIALDKLIYSINNEGNSNPFGSIAVKSLIERNLYGRYKVEETIKYNPDILDENIKEPIFIIGMPRTGTTILHALMHQDKAHRSPLSWECLLPHPVPIPETFNNNQQLATIEKEFKQLFKLVPDFLQKHYMAANSPQECLGITALDFNSFQFSAQLYLPSYMEWFFSEADRLQTMRFHKKFLQYLQSGGVRKQRWLLKSPVHLMRLTEIFEVYPDARIIMTHRHPEKIVPSTSSLISSVRSLYSDSEDPLVTGKEQAETWSNYFRRFMEDRKTLNKEDRIIDLKFEDFVNDQVKCVQRIYDKFGWDLSDKTKNKINTFLETNPKDVHGKHNYTLADFGLDSNEINKQFEHYISFLENL